MTEIQTLDVSHLQPYEISSQSPLWWGQFMIVFIEGTMFAILIAAYFYTRLRMDVWPPPGDQFPSITLPTWIVLIYPALGRMRTLAEMGSVLFRAQKETGIAILSGDASPLLEHLATSVLRVRVDFIHFPLIYYFHSDTEGESLTVSLQHFLDLSKIGTAEGCSDRTRLAASALRLALIDIAHTIAIKFLGGMDASDPCKVFQAAAKDHFRDR